MKQKVLITGGSGLLAVNWALSIRNYYAVTLLLHNKKILLPGVDTSVVSLGSLNECASVLVKYQPDIVINTAGIANVEECESNPDLAQEVNVELARNMAIACSRQGVKLVHISTDHFVLGCQKFSTEKSKLDPINSYASTKLEGEQKVLETNEDALIIRTNFFGWGTRYRQSFSDLIVNNLRSNKKIELFSDVFFTPILIHELSDKVHKLISLGESGIFNVVGKNRLSKYEFGIKLANSFELDASLISAISIDNKTDLTIRPKDMSLSNVKLCKALNCSIPNIDKQFKALKKQNINAINQVTLEIMPLQ